MTENKADDPGEKALRDAAFALHGEADLVRFTADDLQAIGAASATRDPC